MSLSLQPHGLDHIDALPCICCKCAWPPPPDCTDPLEQQIDDQLARDFLAEDLVVAFPRRDRVRCNGRLAGHGGREQVDDGGGHNACERA